MADINELKVQLANGCKVLGFLGQNDVVWGHVSLRIPGTDTFLMKCAEIGFQECTPENIITANLEGEQVGGTSKMHSEVPLHSEILKARPDVNSVVHSHPESCVAFSSLKRTLLPMCNQGALFSDGLPVYSATTDLIREKFRGAEVAQCLGDKNALLMRNHGIICTGTTVAEAVMTAFFLEKACATQLMAMAAGGPDYWTELEEASIKKVKSYGAYGDGKMDRAMDFFVRQLELMEQAKK